MMTTNSNIPPGYKDSAVGIIPQEWEVVTLGKLVSLWMNGFTSFSVKPLRFASYFGCFSSFIGFCYLIFIIANYFIRHASPLGWSSTMAVMLILGGIILVVLGLIGEYVGRIYMCANASPQFVIREIITKDNE